VQLRLQLPLLRNLPQDSPQQTLWLTLVPLPMQLCRPPLPQLALMWLLLLVVLLPHLLPSRPNKVQQRQPQTVNQPQQLLWPLQPQTPRRKPTCRLLLRPLTGHQMQRLSVVPDVPGLPLSQSNMRKKGPQKRTRQLDGTKFVCDGAVRNLTLPLPPYADSQPYDVYTLTGTGLECGRQQGGQCGAQEVVQCAPYSNNIGPITQSLDHFIPPSNPIILSVTNQSIFFTKVAWTVYDVGTGGAKLVGVYSPSASGETQRPAEDRHQWVPRRPSAGRRHLLLWRLH